MRRTSPSVQARTRHTFSGSTSLVLPPLTMCESITCLGVGFLIYGGEMQVSFSFLLCCIQVIYNFSPWIYIHIYLYIHTCIHTCARRCLPVHVRPVCLAHLAVAWDPHNAVPVVGFNTSPPLTRQGTCYSHAGAFSFFLFSPSFFCFLPCPLFSCDYLSLYISCSYISSLQVPAPFTI